MQYKDLDRIASTQHGLITRDQLRTFASEFQIQRLIEQGYIVRAAESIYRVAGAPITWHQQLMVSQLWNNKSVISHNAAVHLHGIDDNGNGFPALEITVPQEMSRCLDGFKVHKSNLMSGAQFRDGLWVTNASRTLIDIAPHVKQKILVRYVENALHQRLLTFPMLRSEVKRIARRGRRGIGTIRELLDLYDPIDDLVEIGLERSVLGAIRRLEMPEPIPQFEVWVDGKQRFIDFAYPDRKIGIEAHSLTWHQRLTAFEKDADRDGALTEAGWSIYYATQRNLDDQLLRVRRQLGTLSTAHQWFAS